MRECNDTRHGVMYIESERGKAGEQGNGGVGNHRVTLRVSATILNMGIMYPETKRGKAGEQGNGGVGNHIVTLRMSNDTRYGGNVHRD